MESAEQQGAMEVEMGESIKYVTNPYALIAFIFVGVLASLATRNKLIAVLTFALAAVVVVDMLYIATPKASTATMTPDDVSLYKTYANDDDFTFRYPANEFEFKPVTDGRKGVFAKSKEGHAYIEILKSDPVPGETTQGLHDEWIVSCAKSPTAYDPVRPKWVVVSCLERTGKGDALYRKEILGDQLDLTLFVAYPASEKSTWDDVVTNLVKSLKLRPHNQT